jgi:hypothetical protein
MMLPNDNYMVRHEHAEEDKARREEYFAGRISHDEYYMFTARDIGLQALQSLVLNIVREQYPNQSLEALRDLLKQDPDLNNIKLDRWDARHPAVTRLAHGAGWRVWTLSDSVCILKAVAKHMDPFVELLQQSFKDA